MQSSKILQHPIIEVAIAGVVVEQQPVSFNLATLSNCPGIVSHLYYPADSDIGKEGGAVTVSLRADNKTDLYFTGEIYLLGRRGANRELSLTDSYQKLYATPFCAAYRKEKAANILDEILGAAGINEKKVTCPDIELARFSTERIQARLCINLLIDALREHSADNLVYFFDEKDVFHFGTKDDTGKNEGEVFSFESAKDILKHNGDSIELLPRPIRHTQKVIVDGKIMLTTRTSMIVSRHQTRQKLWIKESV